MNHKKPSSAAFAPENALTLRPLHFLPQPVFITKPDNSIYYVNPALVELTGFSAAELSGATPPYPWQAEPPAGKRPFDHDDFTELFSGVTTETQEEIRSKSGVWLWVEVSTTLLEDDLLAGYRLTCWRDITKQNNLIQQLRESEERYRNLSNSAFEGLAIHNMFTMLDANQTYANIHGYELSEMIGQSALKLVSPEYREIVMKNAERGFEEPYEIEITRKNGQRVRVEIIAKNSVFRGQPVRVLAVRDLTERLALENRLRESEQKRKIIFDSIFDAVIVSDLKGNIIQLNKAAVKLMGYHIKKDLLGKPIFKLISKKDYKRALTDRQTLLNDKHINNAEYTMVKKDGKGFLAGISMTSFSDESNKTSGFVIILRDITAQKRRQQNMIYYISEITRAQEDERKRIARELHDDTVQSLASLCLDIQALTKKNNPENDGTKEDLQSLYAKTQSIIKEVRRFSHELRPDILDRLGLIPALETLMQDISRGSELNCNIKITGNERRLPAEIELALFRIVQEALNNTRRHAKATEAIVHFRFMTDKIRVKIIDNGTGFNNIAARRHAPQDMSKLGLIGIQERIRLLRGKLDIKSSPNKGTTLYVEIPL